VTFCIFIWIFHHRVGEGREGIELKKNCGIFKDYSPASFDLHNPFSFRTPPERSVRDVVFTFCFSLFHNQICKMYITLSECYLMLRTFQGVQAPSYLKGWWPSCPNNLCNALMRECWNQDANTDTDTQITWKTKMFTHLIFTPNETAFSGLKSQEIVIL